MRDLDTFWSVIAQIALVLGFALVTEARRIAVKWKYEYRFERYSQAIGLTVLAIAIILLLNTSLVQMITDEPASDWLITVVLLTISVVGSILILNPIVSLSTAGGSDLFITARMWLPFSAYSRALRENARMGRDVRRMRRRFFSRFVEVRALQAMIKGIGKGSRLPVKDERAAAGFIRETTGVGAKDAALFVERLLMEGTAPQLERENKMMEALLREHAQEVKDAMREMNRVAHSIVETRRKFSARQIPDEANEVLKARFEAAQRRVTDYAARRPE